uniref:NADH-ubiquinone oxidoreductase chain 4L n=1 Tax=Lepidocampa weberi TaxID=165470 RepID=U3KTJ3_9HEXA|nr:NADH dehydrogenase subunit 4L [Lepidocampa weberi]AEV44882.1 NADH dehydrogenase subunit 4L [Lepidocampa weberi]
MLLLGVVGFGVFAGLLGLFLKHNYLLVMLMMLEYCMLSLFFIMSMFLLELSGDLYFMLFFLTVSVCEGVLGLGILVSMVRSYGNDYFMGLSVLQC